jgi:hypothetical protein
MLFIVKATETNKTMNSETHQVITQNYATLQHHFAVPIDWDIIEDIDVMWGKLYYKGECKDVPKKEDVKDLKYPEEICETMNSETHKVITATYFMPQDHFAVPIDWDIEDIDVMWGKLYYKGECKDVPKQEVVKDLNHPEKITEIVLKRHTKLLNYHNILNTKIGV